MYIYIKSMSEYQSRIYDKITNQVSQLDKHLIRLALYPHSSQVNHWKKEIYSFLSDVDRQKRTKRYPKKSFILKALEIKNDMIDVLTEQVKEIEKDLVIDRDLSYDNILNLIEQYQDWLSTQLSTKGGIFPEDTYKILKTIFECD